MPVPPHDSFHTGTVNGYWFETPINFTITYLRIPKEAGVFGQYIHLLRINDSTPVVHPATSTNFTTLAYLSHGFPWAAHPVGPFQVNAGDIIGVFGAAGSGSANTLSGNVTPYTTTIGTFGVSLNRLFYQGTIMGGPAPNYSTEGYGTPIGRVEIYYIINSSCLSPSGIMSSNVLSTSATLGWTGVSGSQGYDYIVSTSPANPTRTVPFQTTTSTSINATGQTPSTNYFLYLRNKCSSSSYSPWVQYSFWTLPPCDPPSNVKLTNLTPTSVTISRDTVSSATSYDYIVNNDPSSPVSATGWTTVNAPPVLLTGLVENTKYYVHLRSNCPVGEVSNWILDSFMTPVPCREPELQMANIGVNEAVVYWDPVPTVLWYEYDVSRHASPPALGTKYQFTSLHMSALNPGANCYMHVRSFCTSNGTESYSPWETISFKTWQVGVDNLQSESSGIRVYPSPVTDQATIEIHGRVPQDARIELTDLTGRILQGIPVQSSRLVISMAGLSSGWYWIQYCGDGIKENRRILKQ